jgi:hypothetical protein
MTHTVIACSRKAQINKEDLNSAKSPSRIGINAGGRLKRKGWRRARWHTIVVCNLSVFSQYTRERKSLVAAACVRAYCQLVFARDTATRLAISQAAENKVHHVSHADGVCVCVYASPLRRVHYNNIIWNNTTHTPAAVSELRWLRKLQLFARSA